MSGRYIFFIDPSCLVGPNNTVDGRPGVTPDPRCPNASLHRTEPGSADDPTVALLRHVAEIWISLPLVVFGIVGNLLSLVVLCQPRQRQKLRTIIILLRTLAVFDILVLVSVFLVRTMRLIGPTSYLIFYSRAYPHLYPVAYELRLINTWITVLLTVDRYVAVCRPLHAQRMCTVRRTYVQVAAVILLSVLFCLPRHFEYHIVYHSDGHYGLQTTSLILNRTYTVVYRISLFLIVHYFAPTVILVWLNSLVIVALRRSDAYRSANLRRLHSYGAQPFGGAQPMVTALGRDGGPSSAAAAAVSALQSTRGVTVVVVIVVCICIVTHVISTVAQVLHSLQMTFVDEPVVRGVPFEMVRRHLAQTSNVLVTLNSAVNFVVYCMCSRTFRSVLVAQVCCCFCCFGDRRGSAADGRTACRLYCPRCLCWCCCCCCCRDLPVDSLLVRLNRTPPVGGPRSSTVTNYSTRSLTNSIMLSVMPNRIVKKRESLIETHHHDCAPSCGPYRNQHTL